VPPIDPTSDATVLGYTGAGVVPTDIPTRDLHGGDLARIASVQALRDWDGPGRPAPATAETLAALASELVSSGAFTAVTVVEAEAAPDV
jgi:hypothetical protein